MKASKRFSFRAFAAEFGREELFAAVKFSSKPDYDIDGHRSTDRQTRSARSEPPNAGMSPSSTTVLVDVTSLGPELPDFEYSIHTIPRTHRDEVQAIFPTTSIEELLVIPTCQKSAVDLVEWGDAAAQEKDRLLIRFQRLAKAACESLIAQGYWADYIDPCSGLPMVGIDLDRRGRALCPDSFVRPLARLLARQVHKEGNTVYGEVQAMVTLLGYKTANAGCCSVLLHPRWGSSVYPASFFAMAPVDKVEHAIASCRKSSLE